MEKKKPLLKKEAILEEFYDADSGLVSAAKLYKKLKPIAEAKGKRITYAQIEELLENQSVNQIFRNRGRYRKTKFAPIVAKKVLSSVQVDLMDMTKKQKFNSGFKWIYVAIDVHSRFVWAKAMKTKTEGDVIAAFQEQMKEMGVPANLNTDLESAIMGKKFQAILKEKKIKHWAVDPEIKLNNMIVERWNRTIREVLRKYFHTRDTNNWVDILPELISNYNTTFHSTIQAMPKSVFDGKDKNKQERIFPETKLVVGDTVRVLKKYSDFTKMSDQKKFTALQYKITKIQGQTFTIESEDGTVHKKKAYEIQKVTPSAVEKITKKESEELLEEDLKEQKAKRRLRKEDLTIDMVDAPVARPKRERKQVKKYNASN